MWYSYRTYTAQYKWLLVHYTGWGLLTCRSTTSSTSTAFLRPLPGFFFMDSFESIRIRTFLTVRSEHPTCLAMSTCFSPARNKMETSSLFDSISKTACSILMKFYEYLVLWYRFHGATFRGPSSFSYWVIKGQSHRQVKSPHPVWWLYGIPCIVEL